MITASEGTQVYTGSYGSIWLYDLASYLPETLEQMQLSTTSPANKLSSVVEPVKIGTLLNYPEDSNCPDFSFAQLGKTAFVFFKEGIDFPPVETTSIEFVFLRNVQRANYDPNAEPEEIDDCSDIPMEALELSDMLVLEAIFKMTNEKVPFDITQSIEAEKIRLGLQ